MDLRRDDCIIGICSPGSYGLKPCILQLDRAALGASFPKIKGIMFLVSDQCLFSLIQKETDWQTKFIVKMSETVF